MEFKDYYRVLGVDRTADQKTISQAFRRLAREYHPDVNKRRGAEERFKEINEAYQVLGDPAKRARYDQIYDAYTNGGVPWQDLFGRVAGASGWGGPGGVTFRVGRAEDLEDLFGPGGSGGFSDFFQQLFGGLGGFGRAATATRARPRVDATVEITLEEAFHGTRRSIQLPSGQRIDVEIPRGIRAGQTLRLAGAADGGDVFLTVSVAPHRLFERTDDDLTIEVPVTMSEAALGAEVEVPTLEDRVKVVIPAGTQSGQRLRLKGLGMPRARGDGRGDLYVRVRVTTPTRLTRRERELLEELQRLRRENPRAHLW
ncbi:MAG: DnaJ C-terminal domain-containing protein [Armatimonadota bacterium]|nr:DnaJ C-terminal domain-containing protein [Armatimonadota bacterium]MDR7549378.1 DnaJ C-terminal domain-containing protein [Armatimonadota bacterium]